MAPVAIDRGKVVLRGHEAPVVHAAFATSSQVVTASDDGTVRVWDVGVVRPVRTFAGRAVAVSGDGSTVAATARGARRVTVRRTTSGNVLFTWTTPASATGR